MTSPLLFLLPSPIFPNLTPHTSPPRFGTRTGPQPCSCRRRAVPTANININQNTDPDRAEQIAAKIQALRDKNRLPSQQFDKQPESTTDPDEQASEPEETDDQESDSSESGSGDPADDANAKDPDYKPRVSTWGVFPRPDNISKTYGGGRNIQRGGPDLSSESSLKRDADIADKLSAYRSAREQPVVSNPELDARLAEALSLSETLMRRARPKDALAVLRNVCEDEEVSPGTRRGADALMALALAYDTLANRQEAKSLYTRLAKSPFSDVAANARQLLQGFDDMKTLRFDPRESEEDGDESEDDSVLSSDIPVLDFVLPDVAAASTDRPYETALIGSENAEPEPVSAGTSLALAALMLAPVATIVLLVLLRRQG